MGFPRAWRAYALANHAPTGLSRDRRPHLGPCRRRPAGARDRHCGRPGHHRRRMARYTRHRRHAPGPDQGPALRQRQRGSRRGNGLFARDRRVDSDHCRCAGSAADRAWECCRRWTEAVGNGDGMAHLGAALLLEPFGYGLARSYQGGRPSATWSRLLPLAMLPLANTAPRNVSISNPADTLVPGSARPALGSAPPPLTRPDSSQAPA